MSVTSPNPHDSSPHHVSGVARYIDDIPLPANSVHLAFGLSERAHANIAKLDLSAVRSATGVIDVLTADDLPFANDVSPTVHDEPLLATGEAHFHGQPIFLVVADSHLNARKAARLASIDYVDLPAILTIDDAITADSKFEDAIVWQVGDPDQLPNSPHTISGTIEMGGQEHFYLEGQAAAALPNEGAIVVYSSTQHPTEIQHKVAEALNKPFNAIRIETRRMGGGFGGKESQGNALAVACSIVAMRLNRPAKMRYDRDDDMIITGKRHDFRISYAAGFDDTGRLTAITFDHFTRCGWAQDLSLAIADRAMLHADNTYHLPNVRITSHRLRTNTVSNTAYRGFGGPQGVLAIERVMDQIAHELGVDPLTVQQANFYGTEGRNTTPYHQTIEDNIAPEIVSALVDQADYHTRRAEIAEFNATSPILKKGIALTPVKFGVSFTLTHLNQAGALVHVYADGSIHLNHGGTEMGQGLFTKVAQVAATVFNQPLSAVKITATDTEKVPNASATAASSGSDLNGMACKIACEKIRDRLIRFVVEHWQVAATDISFENGAVQMDTKEISFAELAKTAYENRIQLSATGFYKTPKIEWNRKAGKGRPFLYFAYGAAITEVIIDTLTGENRILRTDILHDVGKSLNPAIDIGQIEGAYVQGAGWLTTEELVFDDQGRLRTHAPSTYKIPACADRPREFNVALFDCENREDTIYRSKAVGEPPFMLGISAFLALSNAIASCGDDYPALDAPATAERVLRTVDKVKGQPW